MEPGEGINRVISLVLGLIIFRPQLSVSPGDAIERSQPFSVPFKVSNVGLLSVHNVNIYCYVHRVEAGPATIERSVVGNKDWYVKELIAGESKTVICRLVHSPNPPRKADIAIVADYNVTGLPFKRLRRVERFIGAYADNWQWLHQPSGEIRAKLDSDLKKWDIR